MCNWNLSLTLQKGPEAANLEGLETAEVLEAEASLEASNLEGAAWRARWGLLIQ